MFKRKKRELDVQKVFELAEAAANQSAVCMEYLEAFTEVLTQYSEGLQDDGRLAHWILETLKDNPLFLDERRMH